MVIQIIREMASTVTNGQLVLVAICNMVPPPTIDTVMPIGTTLMTKDIKLAIDGKGITGTARSKNPVGHNRKHVTKPHTRIHEVKLGRKCDSECSVASDFEEHLDEEDVPTPDSPKT